MSKLLIEVVAQYMAETYNGGLWIDYKEEHKEVHRKRASELIDTIERMKQLEGHSGGWSCRDD